MGKEYRIVVNSYASFSPDGNISDLDIEFLGARADTYIIAHALKENGEVVSAELESNATRPKNVRIPSACKKLGIPYKPVLTFFWEIAAKRTKEMQKLTNDSV